eukprot:gene22678-29831_t
MCFATIAENPPTVTSASPIIQANKLSGGENLTITGTRFVMNATVSVGGTACNNIIFVSATSLNCIAPAKSGGIYPIVVINPDSGFSVATHVVVKYNTGNPTTQAYNLLGGDKLTITGTLFAMGATVSIRGTVCISVIVDNSTSLTCVAPGKSAGSYAVVVTNNGFSTAEMLLSPMHLGEADSRIGSSFQ